MRKNLSPPHGVTQATMMWRVLISVVTTLRIVLCDREFCPRSYSRGQYLDPSTQKYHLCWKVDWSDRFITFSANVSTTGWIGLGFSPTGFMTDSDMIIGWVKDGRGYLQVESNIFLYVLSVRSPAGPFHS